MKKVTRKYRMEDTILGTRSSTLKDVLADKLAQVQAFDPGIDTAFMDEWQQAIDALYSFSDIAVVGTSMEIEQSLAETMERCRAKYREVKHFAEKAFPKNKEVLSEFLVREYARASRVPLRLVSFMERLFAVATKYETELVAQDYSAAKIAAIETLRAELQPLAKAKKLKVKERPVTTRKRIEAGNKLYEMSLRASKVLRLAVPGNWAVYKNSLLGTTRHRKDGAKVQWLSISPAGAKKISVKKWNAKKRITLTNRSAFSVLYYMSNKTTTPITTPQTLAAGEVLQTTYEALGNAGKFLVLKNENAAVAKVTFSVIDNSQTQ